VGQPNPADAADTTEDDELVDQPDTEPAEELASASGYWQYQPTDGAARVYAHLPVTVEPGDVIGPHHRVPALDGHWQPHDGPATRDRDNTPQPSDSVAEEE
jgi:hypothetical protein